MQMLDRNWVGVKLLIVRSTTNLSYYGHRFLCRNKKHALKETRHALSTLRRRSEHQVGDGRLPEGNFSAETAESAANRGPAGARRARRRDGRWKDLPPVVRTACMGRQPWGISLQASRAECCLHRQASCGRSVLAATLLMLSPYGCRGALPVRIDLFPARLLVVARLAGAGSRSGIGLRAYGCQFLFKAVERSRILQPHPFFFRAAAWLARFGFPFRMLLRAGRAWD